VAATHLLLGAQWPTWLFWLSPAIGAVLWPVVYVGLDTLRLGRARR
jgi:cell shape-determining protein MreD